MKEKQIKPQQKKPNYINAENIKLISTAKWNSKVVVRVKSKMELCKPKIRMKSKVTKESQKKMKMKKSDGMNVTETKKRKN